MLAALVAAAAAAAPQAQRPWMDAPAAAARPTAPPPTASVASSQIICPEREGHRDHGDAHPFLNQQLRLAATGQVGYGELIGGIRIGLDHPETFGVNVGQRTKAGLRVCREQPCKRRRAASVQAGKKDEPVPLQPAGRLSVRGGVSSRSSVSCDVWALAVRRMKGENERRSRLLVEVEVTRQVAEDLGGLAYIGPRVGTSVAASRRARTNKRTAR